MNQFFYTRKEAIKDTDPVEFVNLTDSINVNKVIRSVAMEDGSLIVLLDDIHERIKEVPVINTKSNKVTGMRKQVEVFQTEVFLFGEDIERFVKLTTIG
jgi:hypothetical protein